ncbi:GDSL esterase/lipase CPRD49 [Morella rubra]|uniref:GDSL esterase/lipase CPRD49 n=1 Tax=Morella rubra TaxID=262757 RepID=A0A6A1WGK8_9ROSI|nr:GDSL esterase/lipase CPRD49 [Morella rubra]
MVGPMRPQFVLFGSSIVQFSYGNEGWGSILADIYARKADILLRGYSGWTSRHALQVLDQVFPKDAVVQPSLVIAYFGGNDSMRPHPSGLGPHVPLPEYIENMRKISIHLKSLSEKTRIIFLSAPPVHEEKIRETFSDSAAELRTNESCRIYAEACLELCREMDVKGIDLWTTLQENDGWQTACFTDGIHLSAEGSKIVVKEILKVLREADWEPSLHWKSMPTEFEHVLRNYPDMRSSGGADPASICVDRKLLGLTPIAPKCRIFKVHQRLRKVNEACYEPALLAIGPYHHGKDGLALMEEQKLRYLQSMLNRRNEKSVEKYIMALRELEGRARSCYAECFSLNTDEFAEMMLLDGCFIIELFRKFGMGNLRDKCDPIFQTCWMLSGLVHDLLLLENQLPFFVLTRMLEMTRCPSEPQDLIDLALNFFNCLSFPWSLRLSHSSRNSIQNIEYLLSLVHIAAFSSIVEIEMAGKAVLTIKELKSMPFATRKDSKSMPCATELQEAGVQFKILEGGNNLINIKFTNGIMEIPPLFILDNTEAFLRNLIAYEQYNRDKDLRVTEYVSFMDCLINSPKDVEVLRRQGIVHNYMGDDEVVSTMFNKLGHYVYH